jgi:probable addiction module antidote protein
MPKRTKSYHAWLLKRLSDPIESERYLKVAMADTPEIFLKALRNVAEANKMAKVAEEAGVNRESLYKALSEDGNPRLSTLESVLKALGMSLTVQLKRVFPAKRKLAPATAAANDLGASGGANNYKDCGFRKF